MTKIAKADRATYSRRGDLNADGLGSPTGCASGWGQSIQPPIIDSAAVDRARALKCPFCPGGYGARQELREARIQLRQRPKR